MYLIILSKVIDLVIGLSIGSYIYYKEILYSSHQKIKKYNFLI